MLKELRKAFNYYKIELVPELVRIGTHYLAGF